MKTNEPARNKGGRPRGEPTKTLSFRVPEKLAGQFSKAAKNIIERLKS